MKNDIIFSGRWCSQEDTIGVWADSDDNLWFNSRKGKLQCPDDFATWGVTSKDFKGESDTGSFSSSSIPVGTTWNYEVSFTSWSKVTEALIKISK